MVTVVFIHPEGGGEVDGAVEGRHDVLNDGFLHEAELRGFDAVHVNLDLGSIQPLFNPGIHSARNRLGKAFDFLRDVAGNLEFVAFDLNVNG